MNRKKRIINILTKYFVSSEIKVIDNSLEHSGHNNFDGSQESHFKIFINNKYAKSLSRLEIHRKINQLLENEFSTGLHALEIKIMN
tara:strand:- start:6 stop:263 length:258 start_codon:yes stop_codon:yes gene_type:complete